MKKVSKRISEPIRVLQIGMHDKIGGVETYLMNYYRNIDRSKVQFDFINTYDNLCFGSEILKLGGNIYNLPSEKSNPYKYFKQLKNIMKKYKIIHINMLSAANILPVMAAKAAGVKHIIVHSHNSNTPSGVLRKVLDKLNRNYLMKNATEFWACSRLAGEWLFGLSICSGNKFKLIYNAVDSSFFNYDMRNRKKIRKELNIDNKFVIGHVGRFCYQKNHDFLIRMFNLYLKTNPDSVLLLIGEGELKSSIKNIVDNFGINDKVLFLGTTNKVYEYLSVFDLFVLPSRFEGLPVVGIEAQAVGINCIFSDLISSELKINDNVVFSPLDEKIWVDKINCVKSLKLKDNNIHNNYDIFKESKKLEKEYFKLFYD